ncbi:MAG: hypothetical protein JXR60_10375 [Bacteroidales bacterium]|nr:hypothetical protein [Bacteroidales bacterium]
MKKITLLVVAFALFMVNANAQEDLVSKKGYKILPEAGDIAFGVDFAPFIKTVNLNASNTAPSFDFGDQFTIFVKKYNTADMAYRLKFAFNNFSQTDVNYVTDESVLAPTPEDQIADKGKFSYTQAMLSLGVEKRRGHNRLQGYYGADVFLFYFNGLASDMNFKGTYGNEFSSDNANPVSTNFVGALNGYRTATYKSGGMLGFGARAFIGAEYFIAPKISIGGELGWGLGYGLGMDGYQIDEEWDPVAGEVKATKVKTGRANQFMFGSDSSSQGFFENNGWLGLGGNINLIFHF